VTEGTITYAILLIVRFTADTVTRWLRRKRKSYLVALQIYIYIFIYYCTNKLERLKIISNMMLIFS